MHLRRRQQVTTVGVAVIATALGLSACTSSSSTSTTPPAGSSSSGGASSSSGGAALSGTLNASGSTFQLTFQQEAISAFKSVQSGMTVNYGGGGSGKGRTDLSSGTVNFAGSDSPIPSKEASNFTGKTILYFPVIIGPITMSYNLSGVSKLQLSPATIAGIFSGKIKTWNDAAIKADNSGVTLPSTPITLAVRADSSGTTQNFTEFLVKSAPSAWSLGSSSTIKWPSRGGAGRQVHSRRDRLRGLRHGQGLRAELRVGQEPDRLLHRAVVRLGVRGRRRGHRHSGPDLPVGLGQRGQLLPDHLPVVGPGQRQAAERQPNANDVAMLKAYLGYLLGPGQQLLTQIGLAPLPSSIDQMAVAQLSKITS